VGGLDEVHRVCSATAGHIKAAHQKKAEESTFFGEATMDQQAAVVVVGDQGQQSQQSAPKSPRAGKTDTDSVFGEATEKGSAHVTVVDDLPKTDFDHRLKFLAYGSLAMMG